MAKFVYKPSWGAGEGRTLSPVEVVENMIERHAGPSYDGRGEIERLRDEVDALKAIIGAMLVAHVEKRALVQDDLQNVIGYYDEIVPS